MSEGHRNICIINGHPHDGHHFVTALSDAYERGARETGYEISRIDVGKLNFEPLRDPKVFETNATDQVTIEAQAMIKEAQHLVFLFPMWFGGLPGYTRCFIERVGCGNFFLEDREKGWPRQTMGGKSIRIVMTMGMPTMVYRMVFGAFSLRGLEKNVFGISGFSPIKHTLIGMVEQLGDQGRQHWIDRIEDLGRMGR